MSSGQYFCSNTLRVYTIVFFELPAYTEVQYFIKFHIRVLHKAFEKHLGKNRYESHQNPCFLVEKEKYADFNKCQLCPSNLHL